MSNVAAILTGKPPTEVNESLCNILSDLLQRAEAGELQSLIASGFTADGMRLAVWADQHPNVYEMLGALAWLQVEYVHRHTD